LLWEKSLVHQESEVQSSDEEKRDGRAACPFSVPFVASKR
jgi:hypothetical protein